MQKPTLIAVSIFGVLALAFIATRERQVTVGVHKLELAPVSADALVELSFGPVVLRAEGGTWTVGSGDQRFPADEGMAKAAQQALAELKADDFVSDRPEKHAELEVDEAKGLPVKGSTTAGVVRSLVLGKASRSGGAYVREAKSNVVFALNGTLPSLARRDLTSWRKRAITTAKADEVSRVTVTPPSGAPWSLASEAGSWKLETAMPKDYRFDPAAAQRLVGQLAGLSAQDFPTGPLEEPSTTFTLELKGGKSVGLRLGAKRPDGTRMLVVDGDAQPYLLPSWQAERLVGDPEELRDLRLLHFAPAQVTRLSLVSAGKKTVVSKEGESWKVLEPKALPAGFDFDPQQVTAQLSRLASLHGQKLVRDVPEAKAGLGRPAVEVELALEGGATQRVRFGTEPYAKSEDGLTFTATAQDKSWLESGVELFKRPPPRPSGGMQGLDQLPPEIRAQLEAQLRQQQR